MIPATSRHNPERGIIVERDVADPVEPVLDPPMASDPGCEGCWWCGLVDGGGDEVDRLPLPDSQEVHLGIAVTARTTSGTITSRPFALFVGMPFGQPWKLVGRTATWNSIPIVTLLRDRNLLSAEGARVLLHALGIQGLYLLSKVVDGPFPWASFPLVRPTTMAGPTPTADDPNAPRPAALEGIITRDLLIAEVLSRLEAIRKAEATAEGLPLSSDTRSVDQA